MIHHIYHTINEIPTKDWETVHRGGNLYLSLGYLKALEDNLQDQVSLFFSVSYLKDVPVLITAFQLVTFIDKREQSHKSVLKIFSDTKSKKQPFKMNMLVCGNVFADGEHGFIAAPSVLNTELIEQLITISETIKKQHASNKKISVRLFKEFWPRSVSKMDGLLEHRFKDFKIDVNMVLDIHPSWATFDDYLQSMKAKFRTKTNGTYKRAKDLKIQSLSTVEILNHKDRIDQLFTNVLDKSEYSFGRMNALVFAALKNNCGDSFSFVGVFLKQQLVGFSIGYFHQSILEAGYVGIDYKYNVTYAIYQRILYHYVEQAIDAKVTQLQLGRTSELIKSALGAKPVDMKLYAKHKRPITNLIMGAVLNKVSPSDYELRRPFKSGFEV